MKYVAVTGIADKDNVLIPMGETFDDSRLDKEVKARFIKLGAIKKPEEVEADSEFADIFEPLSVEETVERMNNFDFSERVARSATFHGEAIKVEILRQKKGSKNNSSSRSNLENNNESDALTLENLKKMDAKSVTDLAKARNLTVDPKAKTEELAQLVYDHDLANAG